MSIVITPNVKPVAAQAVTTADIVLQPGSVISARVLQILGNDQVQISIGGQPIDVTSQVPLQAGQTLQLQVSQTASGIGLAIVSQQGGAAAGQAAAGATATLDSVTLAPNAAAIAALAPTGAPVASNPLTALETLAVALAAQTAATQQTSLAPLFANLGAAAGLAGLPPQVQQAVAQVLAQQTSLDPNLSGGDIQHAFQNSGLFLEASLASGSVSPSTPDLKAALIVLRQVLTTSLASVAAGTSPGIPGTPAAAATSLTAQQATTPAAVAQAATAVEALAQQAATALGAVAATLVQPGTTPATVVLAQAAQPSIQLSEQTVTIVAGPETPAIVSPPIAPSLASATTASLASTQAAPLAVAQEILDLSAANAILSPASTPADAAARAAVSSAALNLLQEAVQAGPLAGSPPRLVFENGQMLSLMPAVTGARTPAIDDPEFARTNLPPPPINGALPSAQPVMPATLVAHAPVEATLQHLLTDTDGAIARQTLLQVASLPGQTDTTAGRLDPSVPRWNFEIPFVTPQGTAMAQFEISRDGGGREVGAAKPVWRARFSLDVEPAGPVHAQVSLSGERTSVRMWAERPATAAQLRAGVSQLSQALSRAELQPGDIVVRDGAPLQPASAPAGHFLDRAL
ncbi:MAG: flagellar hook-length control protein FliK [Bradyrhizobium sp.]|uniref:flagellar hook-length control protein FliK n=1 Tax=Bradyrhizobium sp. TaxID=376 RepID=UPI0012228D21|nr:flagellar hook-length control protein FliK [Bradyrhizobium sp.]THD56635.1 MAG: flagellar hook-length control protein FliK [Bradyrhizobium sp.]